VARDSIPSAVVALAPNSGVTRCDTVSLKATSSLPSRRASCHRCMMWTSSAIASTTTSGTSMLVSTL
jgi:hypothetical protein